MAFFSTYKLYKQGTSQVVTWLGKTAARFGYEWSTGSANGEDTHYVVSVKELPVLARVISEHVHQMSDSKALRDILQVLKDVIIKRKEWTQTFQLPDASTLTANMQHKHFVHVLEDVYQILGGSMNAIQAKAGKGQQKTSDGKSTSREAMTVSNLFAVLDIEEPVEQVDTVPGSARSPSPDEITYELEDEMDLEEVYFIIYCFFEDFQAIRQHIAQGWADYRCGLLDLSAVALTTNVALEMLQRAETTLLEIIPKKYNLNGYYEIADLMVKAVALARGVGHWRDDVLNTDLKDIAEFVCMPVYSIVETYTTGVLESLERNGPVMKKGFCGMIYYSGKGMTWREKFAQDEIVLLEFLQEFWFLKEVKMAIPMAIPVLDELSSGLMEMTRTRDIPAWLLLGCQIYLDIHHTMLSDMGKALKDLQIMGRHVSTTLQKYLDFCKDIETWSGQTNVKAIRLVKLEADLWINRDLLGARRKKLFEKYNPPEAATKSHSVLSRQPILCGIMLLRLSLKLQEVGVGLVNSWGSLPSVVHLYNAVKHESSEKSFPVWQDGEDIIQIQGMDRIFVGDIPKNVEQSYKSFCLAFGGSASLFATNRRVLKYNPDNLRRALSSSRGPRTMIVTSTIADILSRQYCRETRFEVTIHKLEELFSTSSSGMKSGTSQKDGPVVFTSTVVSFLSTLQAYIQSESFKLDIDYFALHMRCWTLLREIHANLYAEFCKIGSIDLEKEVQLPFVVGFLFKIERAGKKEAKHHRKAGRGGALERAGDLLKEFVEKEENPEVERVRKVRNCFDCNPEPEDLPPLEPIRRPLVIF